MKNYLFFLPAILLISLLLMQCAKPKQQEVRKPMLLIKIRDDAGKGIAGATVTLYKSSPDTGITQLSDSTGAVIFAELEPVLYYWLAKKGCKTNLVSQTTLDRPLVPRAILYGYSVLAETGTLKIINNATEPYLVSDTLINITINKDTPYIAHRRVGPYLIHSEKTSTPGIGKDTLINIKCSDTTILRIPY